MRTIEIIMMFLALVAGNYLYQWLFAPLPDYLQALDRSFFQLVAITALAMAGYFKRETI